MNKEINIKYLDDEERDLEKAIESLDTSKLKEPSSELQNKLRKAAKNHLKQETKMNIRIDPLELEEIKRYAQNQGLKYQTFIKSVLHKYLTGQLVDKNKVVG